MRLFRPSPARRARSAARSLSLSVGLLAVTFLPSCTSNCATYAVDILVLDATTDDYLCNARVVFFTGDAGTVLDASIASTDAEVPSSSSACQWDIVVDGGGYAVTASSPGFVTGTATLTLPKDECGSANAPVTVVLVRS